MLEPYEGKLSRTVLRGEGGSNTADLPDQIIEQKQKFISQVMTSRSPARSCEDVDGAALDYAEVKALATGNPHIREKMSLDIEVSKLRMLKMAHDSQQYQLEDDIARNYPHKIKALEERVAGLKSDIALCQRNVPADRDSFAMTVAGQPYFVRKAAGSALLALCQGTGHVDVDIPAGEYLGLRMSVMFSGATGHFHLTLKGEVSHSVELGMDPSGCITRIDNLLSSMPEKLEKDMRELANARRLLETAKQEAGKPFEKEAELNEKLLRLAELNALLDMDKPGDMDIDETPDKPGNRNIDETPDEPGDMDIDEDTDRQGDTGRDMDSPGRDADKEDAAEAGETRDQAAGEHNNRAGEPPADEKRNNTIENVIVAKGQDGKTKAGMPQANGNVPPKMNDTMPRSTAGKGAAPGTGKPSLRGRLVEMKQRAAAQGHSPARTRSAAMETGMVVP